MWQKGGEATAGYRSKHWNGRGRVGIPPLRVSNQLSLTLVLQAPIPKHWTLHKKKYRPEAKWNPCESKHQLQLPGRRIY